MRVVVGLGNPGSAYAETRHNAGFLLADVLAARWRLPRFRVTGNALVTEGSVRRRSVLVAKPQTYMNRSGEAVRALLAGAGADPAHDLLVLVDDLALPLGRFRLRARGSAGGHRGLESIEDALGSREYGRLRIGIGPLPEGAAEWAEFVLAPFTGDERDALDEMLPVLVEAVECWVADGMEVAMNRFNRRGMESA